MTDAAYRALFAAPVVADDVKDAHIDNAALVQTGFDGVGTQAMNIGDIRRIVYAAMKGAK